MDEDIAELLSAGVEPVEEVPQASQALRVAAFEKAYADKAKLEDFLGHEVDKISERAQVKYMAPHIDRAQDIQRERRGVVRIHDSVVYQFDPPQLSAQAQMYMHAMADLQDYYVDLNIQAKKIEFDAAIEWFAEMVNALGVPLEEAARALASAIQRPLDDIITAMRPLLNLLDQKEVILSQPECPSHRIALRGGRCPRCDRGRNRNPRH